MAERIAKQPNGRYAIFSTVVDNFTVVDATESEVTDHYINSAIEDGRRTAEVLLKRASENRYLLDECLNTIAAIHGDSAMLDAKKLTYPARTSSLEKAKPTPGPWDIGGYAGEHEEAGATIVAANGRSVCHTRGALSMQPKEHWEDDANARLITAAPDLLAACKAALGAFEHAHAIDWNDLQRAIEKAEGPSC